MSENWWESDLPTDKSENWWESDQPVGTSQGKAGDDPFEGESFGDLATRRGQQAAQGATETIAAIPESLAIKGVRADESRREGSLGGIEQRNETIAGIEARLSDPSLKPEERAFLERNLADLRAGVGVLGQQAAEPIVPAKDRELFKAGDRIREASEEVFGAPDPRDTSFWASVAQGAGNVAGMVGGTLAVGAVAGPGAAIAAGGFQGSAMNESQVYREAIEAGVDEATAQEAARIASLVGASEIIPITRALKLLPPSMRGRATNALMRRVIDISKNAGEEAVQEGLAQIANNMIAQGYYDPERGWNDNVTESMLVGAVLGGALGATVSVAADDGPAGGGGVRDEEEKPAGIPAGEVAPDQSAALVGARPTTGTPTPSAPGAAPEASGAEAIAPDEQAALGTDRAQGIARDVLGGQPDQGQNAGTVPPAPTAPPAPAAEGGAPAAPEVAPQQTVAPEGNQPEEAPVQPEPPAVPEAPETLEAQREALIAGKKKAVLYTFGTEVPAEIPGKRVKRILVPGVGVLDYDSKQITAREILALNKFGKLNEVLDLGPYNKQEAVATPGEPTAVVERTPDGTEVKAAAGTETTAPEQVAALEETKAAPENTVAVEDPAGVISDRVAAQPVQEAQPDPVPEPNPETTEDSVVDALRTVEQEQQVEGELAAKPPETIATPEAPQQQQQPATPPAQSVRERAIRALEPQLQEMGLTPEEVLAMPDLRQRRILEKAKIASRAKAEPTKLTEAPADQRQEQAPKGAAILEIAKKRAQPEAAPVAAAQPETPVGQTNSARAPVTVPEADVRAMAPQLRELGMTVEEVLAKTPGEQRVAMAKARSVVMPKDEALEPAPATKAEKRAQTRAKKREAVAEVTRQGKIRDSVAETRALIEAGGRKGDPEWEATLLKNAEIAGDLMEQYATEEFAPIERTPAGKAALLERLKKIMDAANERGFVWGRKGVGKYNATAVTWLYDVRTHYRKLVAKSGSYDEFDRFLTDEAAAKRGDVRNMAERRLEEGTRNSKPQGRTDAADMAVAPNSAEPAAATLEAVEEADTGGDTAAALDDTADRAASVPLSKRGARMEVSEGAASEVRTVDDATKAEIAARYGATGQPDAAAKKKVEAVKKAKEAEQKPEAPKEPAQVTKGSIAAALRKFFNGEALSADDQAAMAVVMKNIDDVPGGKELLEDGKEDAERVSEIIAEIVGPKDAKPSKVKASGSNVPDVTDADVVRHKAMASSTTTVARAVDEIASPSLLGDMRDMIWWFTDRQKKVQRATAKTLGRILKDLVPNVKIYVVPDSELPNGLNGYYDPDTDSIIVRQSNYEDPTAKIHIVIHETSHAAMSHRINSHKPTKARIEYLRAVSKHHAARYNYDGAYGFTDVHEFIAELWSSPEFQEFLSTVPITPAEVRALGVSKSLISEIRNALDAVKMAIGRVFTFDRSFTSAGYPIGTRSALNLSMDLSGDILAYAGRARADYFAHHGVKPSMGRMASRSRRPAVEMPDGVSRYSLEGRLISRGVRQPDAKDIAELIKSEYGGRASKKTMDEIAKRVIKEYPQVKRAEATRTKKVSSVFSTNLGGIRDQIDKNKSDVMEQLKTEFVPDKPVGRVKLLWLATNYQIAQTGDRYFGKNNPLRLIARLIENRRVTKARYLKRATPLIERVMAAEKHYRKKNPKLWADYESLIQDSTMANVHPDRSLADNKHLTKNGMSDVWMKEQHAGLRARFDALPQDLKDLYADARDHYTDTQNAMTYKLIENIFEGSGIEYDAAMVERWHEGKPTAEDRAAVGATLARHLEAATELRRIEGPYFNLVRRGEFVVHGRYKVDVPPRATLVEGTENVVEFKTLDEAKAYAQAQKLRSTVSSVVVHKDTGKQWVTDKDGKEVKITKKDFDAEQRFRVKVQNRHVEFHDSMKEARAAYAELKASGLQMSDVEPKRYEPERQNSEMVSSQMRALAATVDTRLTGANLSSGQKAEIARTLNEVALRFQGATRIQSSRLPRRYVAGASKDLARNLFEYSDSAAGYLARLETAPALQEAMKTLEERVSALSARDSGSGAGARELSNEIEKRLNRETPGEDDGLFNPISRRITAFAFLDSLLSPMYSIINSTQVGMFTLPVLSGDFSMVKATAAITRAYNDVGAARMALSGVVDSAKALTGKMVTGDHFIDDVKSRLKNDRERQMIDALADSGLIDADGGLEVARVLDAQKKTVGGTIDKGLHYFDNLARALPQAVEAINRTVTSVAAYRLKYEQTKDHDAAVQYAMDVVNDTQALMSNSNAAPVFSHPVFRISLQFKKFGQMTYYLLGKQIGRIIRPLEKGERIKAIKSLAGLMAAHQAVAGTVGLPFEPFKIALMVFSGLGPGDYEWEDFKEDMEAFYAKLFGERAATNLTYGVTRELGIDLNSRLGLDSLLLFGEPRSYERAEIQSYLWQTIAGPAGRTVADAVSGVADALDGDFSNLYKTVPVKFLNDIGRAIDGGREGTMDTQDQILRIIGVSSARQAEKYQEIGSDIRERKRADAAYKDLTGAYIKARTAEELRAARLEILRYNAQLEPGMKKITFPWMNRVRRDEKLRWAD